MALNSGNRRRTSDRWSGARWVAALAVALLGGPALAEVVIPTAVRGSATVMLVPESEPFTLVVAKRDLNIYEGEDTLQATVLDATRREVATLEIGDDGNASRGGGMAAEEQLAQVTLPTVSGGIYQVLVRVSGDSVWGLRAQASRYLVRGQVAFNNHLESGVFCFQPPAGQFKVTFAALHQPGLQTATLLDAAGAQVHRFDVSTAGRSQGEDIFGPRTGGSFVSGEQIIVAAEVGDRSGPWQLPIGKLNGKVLVEKVDHWTLDPAAWLDAQLSRWMLLPYSNTRFLLSGGSAELDYTLRNSTGRDGLFELDLELPEGLRGELVSPANSVRIPAGGKQEVRVRVTVGAGLAAGTELIGHLRANGVDEPAAAAGAAVRVVVGPSPLSRPVSLPITHRRYQHENYQFGYAPDYVANEVYFDPANRPYIRERSEERYPTRALTWLDDEGGWVRREFGDTIQAAYPNFTVAYMGGGFLGAKVAFDPEGGAYTVIRALMGQGNPAQCMVIFTPDRGETYTLHPIPGSQFDIEQFTGANHPGGPPPVLALTQTRDHPARFCSYNDMVLFVPRRDGHRLDLGEPIPITDRCLGMCQHSGGPASLASRDGRTHIVWGEVTENDDDPGVPTYIATVEHATRQLSEKVFLGFAPPVNDVHNVPAITMDSAGYLHVLTGAHGDTFQYRRSLQPNDALGGWTEAEPVLTAGYTDDKRPEGWGRQTYISLVCDQNDTLHIAYRQWRNREAHHDGRIFAALSYQRKPAGEPWSEAIPVVYPAVDGYSIYYHKLTVDRLGRLFLSYNHYTSDETYQSEFPDLYRDRAVVTSADGGLTWKLAETADFVAGMR